MHTAHPPRIKILTMKYDFDTRIDRNGTAAVKIDGMAENWGRTDLLPLWVADMDFATAPFVTEALRQRCLHPIFGYTIKHDGYYEAIIRWNRERYGLTVRRENIHYVPGIVPGIGMAINALTQPGDRIMIQPPVYHPFAWLCERNGRQVVRHPLRWSNSRPHMDLDTFRQTVRGCRVFILCHPHNPGGLVWSEAELQEVAHICAEEGVTVFSDERHADLTLPPHRHRPFASVSEEARLNSVTFMSPSKAFNMPGLSASHALIFNDELDRRFSRFIDACELDLGHAFAFIAVEAAYSHGTEWLNQCLEYIQGNIDYVDQFLQQHTPCIKALRPEASYLIWLDAREMKLTQEELNRFFVDKARLAVNDGAMFGPEGTGFMRINVGTPRSIVEQAMHQLADAYREWEEKRDSRG